MIIDYKLTGRCNSKCEFCWDFCAGEHEETLEAIQACIGEIRPYFNAVSLTGGEPLLHPRFDEVVALLRRLGFEIYLSTNGYLLKRHVEAIAESVQVVGLPLDSVHPDINKQMGRRADMRQLTHRNISMLRERNEVIPIKIGTVATKINASGLIELGEWLFSDSSNSPDYWRVYQFTPMGGAIDHVNKYGLSDPEYMALTTELSERFGDKVSFLSSSDVEGSYMFVTPKLELAIPSNDSYSVLVDLKSVDSSTIKRVMSNRSQLFDNSRKIRRHLTDALEWEPLECARGAHEHDESKSAVLPPADRNPDKTVDASLHQHASPQE